MYACTWQWISQVYCFIPVGVSKTIIDIHQSSEQVEKSQFGSLFNVTQWHIRGRAVHKWLYPLRREGGSAKSWHYYISLFSKIDDKGEGGVKNRKKWVTSFMDSPLYTPQNSDLLWICLYKLKYLGVICQWTYIKIF